MLWQGTSDEDVVDVVAAQHLQEVRLTARYCLADALLERGETTEAIIVLRAMLSEDPLREPAWERLLLAQQAAGWQVDALANYEQARLAPLENFGAEPGTRLQDIYRTLLSQTANAPAPTVKNSVSPSAESGPQARLRLSLAAVLVVLLLPVTGSTGASVTEVGSPAATSPPVTGGPTPKILFGLGVDAIPAERSPLIASGIGMITTWYHKSDQLDQFEGWRADVIPRIYGYGRAMHLVVATWDDRESIDTRFGRACGQAYPLSPEFTRHAPTRPRFRRQGRRTAPLHLNVPWPAENVLRKHRIPRRCRHHELLYSPQGTPLRAG
ncbi:transcriptional activator domain-containing protein [Micromonospora carbonacea]|uniref:Transcriptional activator domain-containing protein n=2 Tax=Micromonospora carbonacea TaxID=47853 RepID=A0A1C5AZ06_9ACTN|nr:transcriptional activator domain-containing protein [Micromonospora carbonacea]